MQIPACLSLFAIIFSSSFFFSFAISSSYPTITFIVYPLLCCIFFPSPSISLPLSSSSNFSSSQLHIFFSSCPLPSLLFLCASLCIFLPHTRFILHIPPPSPLFYHFQFREIESDRLYRAYNCVREKIGHEERKRDGDRETRGEKQEGEMGEGQRKRI